MSKSINNVWYNRCRYCNGYSPKSSTCRKCFHYQRYSIALSRVSDTAVRIKLIQKSLYYLFFFDPQSPEAEECRREIAREFFSDEEWEAFVKDYFLSDEERCLDKENSEWIWEFLRLDHYWFGSVSGDFNHHQ